MERITGEVLGKSILNWLTSNNISLADLHGQCYDGASNMSGAKAIVQWAAPKATYMHHHCAAHCLNLSIVSACKILMIKSAKSFLGEVTRLFSFSPKRQKWLGRAIEASNTTPRAKKLKDACRTRWVERIDSYAVFLQLLPALHTCLEAIVIPICISNWELTGAGMVKLSPKQMVSFFCFTLLPS